MKNFRKGSIIEKLTKRYFKTIFEDKNVKYNFRPDWLKNPLTGYNLELDIYYPDLKFAVEVDGFTHEISLYQQKKDRIKDRICKERGIYLMRVKLPRELLKEKVVCKIYDSLGIKYHLERLSHSFKRKLRRYNTKPKKRSNKYYNKVRRAILEENKWQKYEDYESLQKRETRDNKKRMEALKNWEKRCKNYLK